MKHLGSKKHSPMPAMLVRFLAAALAAMALLLLPAVNLLLRDQGRLSTDAVSAARVALEAYLRQHPDERPLALAVVDYTRPSCLKRMVIIDLKIGNRRSFRVAHGRMSGGLYARDFSDVPESNMSSLGLYRVLNTYTGVHGKALRLEGLDPLQNGNAFRRDIVLHAAGYVSIPYIVLNLVTLNGPRIGRSNGCLVVSPDEIDDVALRLGTGGFIYAWAGPAQQGR